MDNRSRFRFLLGPGKLRCNVKGMQFPRMLRSGPRARGNSWRFAKVPRIPWGGYYGHCNPTASSHPAVSNLGGPNLVAKSAQALKQSWCWMQLGRCCCGLRMANLTWWVLEGERNQVEPGADVRKAAIFMCRVHCRISYWAHQSSTLSKTPAIPSLR